MCVWKFSQNRIMPRRLEVFHGEVEDRIQQRSRVQHVKIERRKFVAEMQFRIVIEWTAGVVTQLLIDRPQGESQSRVALQKPPVCPRRRIFSCTMAALSPIFELARLIPAGSRVSAGLAAVGLNE